MKKTDVQPERRDAPSGSPTPVTDIDESQSEIWHTSPAFLPDGGRFIFYAESKDPAVSGLASLDLDSLPAQLTFDRADYSWPTAWSPDERKSRVIELRFFGGLSVEDTAEVLHVSRHRETRLADRKVVAGPRARACTVRTRRPGLNLF